MPNAKLRENEEKETSNSLTGSAPSAWTIHKINSSHYMFKKKAELLIVTWEVKDRGSKEIKRWQESLVKGRFVLAAGEWMMDDAEEHSRDKEAEGKRCWREKVHDKGSGARPNMRLEEPHFVLHLLWLGLRTVVQEQLTCLHSAPSLLTHTTNLQNT